MNTSNGAPAPGNEELTIIQRIIAKDIRESAPKGKAEVIAIVSGVGYDAQPKVSVRQMPFLTESNQSRNPHMDIVNWNEFASKYVNIEFWELDGDLDFNHLARGVVESVGDIADLVAPSVSPGTPAEQVEKLLESVTKRSKAAVSLVSRIGEAVLKTMGSGSWLKDDHDYLDTFYTIERGEYYKDRVGANRNITITLQPK